MLPTLEWVLLVVGIVAMGATVAVVHVMRRRFVDDARRTANPGLIATDAPPEIANHLTPGLLGTLIDQRADTRDVMVTLVDLAIRGYIRIKPLVETADRGQPQAEPYDWLLVRDDQRDAGLTDYEKALLTFNTGKTTRRTSITLSALAGNSSRPVAATRTKLQKAAVGEGWLTEVTREYRNAWGCLGGAVLLIGLVAAVVMIIGGLAGANLQGIIGSMLIAVSGAMLASLGRFSGHQTPEGEALHEQAMIYRNWLDRLAPEQVGVDQASAIFNHHLAPALVFGLGDEFGRVFDQAAVRASRWGGFLDVEHAWFDTTDLSCGAQCTPGQLAHAVANFVALGGALINEEHSDPDY